MSILTLLWYNCTMDVSRLRRENAFIVVHRYVFLPTYRRTGGQYTSSLALTPLCLGQNNFMCLFKIYFYCLYIFLFFVIRHFHRFSIGIDIRKASLVSIMYYSVILFFLYIYICKLSI